MDKASLSRLNSPLTPFLIVAVIIPVFIFARLKKADFDPSSFVVAGDTFCDPSLVPKNLTVTRGNVGHDGQFYYRFALNPFTSKITEYGVTLDAPAYRQQRILYPAVTWALALGNANLVPTMLILVNYFALCLIGWVGGAYAQSLKRHALWGIFLPLYPGFLITLSRDLTEILEVCLLLSSLLLVRRGRHVYATIVLTLAILAKEPAILVAVAAGTVYPFRKWKPELKIDLKWYYFTAPLAAYFLWQVILYLNWRATPLPVSRGDLGLPFAGVTSFFLEIAQLRTDHEITFFFELLFLIGFALSALYHLRSTAASLHEVVSWLLYVSLSLFWSRYIWNNDVDFLRALSEFYVLGTLLMIGSRLKVKNLIMGSFAAFWLYRYLRFIVR